MRVLMQSLREAASGIDVVSVGGETVIGSADRRGEHRRAVQCAMVLQRPQQPGHRARNTDGVVAGAAGRCVTQPDVVVRPDGSGSRLAVVDRDLDRLAPIAGGFVDHHEPAAPDPAGVWPNDREAEARRDRSVHRIAAELEHLDTRL